MRLKASKKFYYSLIGVVAIFVIAFLAFVISPFAKNGIPSTFNEARINASSLSQEIVSILGGASENIGKLQDAQRQSESLEIVLNSMQEVEEAKEKANQLGDQLKIMGNDILRTYPKEAEDVAYAMQSQVSLISRLIFYNEQLINLLSLIQKRFNGGNVSIENINNLIDDINRTADEINNFNKQFVDLIKKFDSYYEE